MTTCTQRGANNEDNWSGTPPESKPTESETHKKSLPKVDGDKQ